MRVKRALEMTVTGVTFGSVAVIGYGVVRYALNWFAEHPVDPYLQLSVLALIVLVFTAFFGRLLSAVMSRA